MENSVLVLSPLDINIIEPTNSGKRLINSGKTNKKIWEATKDFRKKNKKKPLKTL